MRKIIFILLATLSLILYLTDHKIDNLINMYGLLILSGLDN